jgi:hypothetical protein
MSVRSTPGTLYSNDAELLFVESEIARIMYAVGLDWADIDTTTIDDIVDKIRETFIHGNAVGSESATVLNASDEWLVVQQEVLIGPLRRTWRRRALAIGRA